ncbi:DNA-directed RNA polymerases IV and V subunit 4-like isoform X2 [Phalaenopsis equestris]|uniref:DNA-directed RNA polymerases IV and V subunit 4-like isoform X2 n=1 Tax=Phalaenopsis equestris TaxID=78828 RepID=UPI0009E3C899|nr:DNA-directed RNA polymerases IV and V subunit 4-like isoform X2 [Phalaenopsis equestris]
MAEKGGKGDPQPKGKILKKSVVAKPGKPSKESPSNLLEIDSSDSEYEGFVDIKSPSAAKGDDKGFSDLKTGKVSSAGLKSSGKTSFEKSSDDQGKGGKAFKAGKGGGKGGLPQTKPAKSSVVDKELKLELELPPGAKLVLDCEAADILQGIQEHLDSLKDPKIKIPESFGKTMQYLKDAVHYTDVKSVRHALDLKKHGATDGEICMIANAGPDTCEEAYGLIPSLKDKKDRIGDPLNVVLASLAKFKVNQEIPH